MSLKASVISISNTRYLQIKKSMMNKVKQIILFIGLLISINLFSQSPFTIVLEPIEISDLGGLQSFAYGQYEGKWLIVGGRLDGLHRRQPWAAFDVAGNNNQILVVDPINQEKWTAPLTSLASSIQEQLNSTNMNFYQEGDYLYCLGGYGYSPTVDDHITFGKLTAIKISDVINAVINNTDYTDFFRQIDDPEFQVTGGRLKKINDNYYLLGGQKFMGRYNPMGPNSGPGFIQEYTNSIRIFSIEDDGTTITINHLPSYTDTVNLHRRDYNAEAQILPSGAEGITMFSGVFQHEVEFPFLNCVDINLDGYVVNNSFQQYYNHYHCAVIPLYASSENKMHTVFFGGIAQYYDDNGTLVQDDNVPFVKTIARVTREADGIMAEYKLPIEMPTLLGAGAEFIPNFNIPHYNNEVFKLDEITEDSTLIGYIYGGISSSATNIFFINDGTQSTASSQIFKVYLTNEAVASADDLNEASKGTLNLIVYPNPSQGNIVLKYNLIKRGDVKISIYDIQGRLITEELLKNQAVGEQSFSKNINNLSRGSIYLIQLETPYETFTEKLIVEE